MTSVRMALDPVPTVTSLVLESLGLDRGSPRAWVVAVHDALAPVERDLVRPLCAPDGHGRVPACLLPVPTTFEPAFDTGLRRIRSLDAEALRDGILATDLAESPWWSVARAPARWLTVWISALERAWRVAQPWWTAAADLLDDEVRRTGALLARGDLAQLAGLGVDSAPAVLVPLLGGGRSGFRTTRSGGLRYVAYPLPGVRRLAAGPAAPGGRAELRGLLGAPRCDLLRRLDGASTAGALATALHLAPSAITHHVAALEHAGLVERERSGRHVLVRRTARGDALLELYGQSSPSRPISRG